VRLAVVTARELLDDAVARLTAAGVPTPRVDAEWLLADALAVRRARLYAVMGEPVGNAPAERYEASIRRRVARVPLQHIVGTQAFRDVTVSVGPDVLVPRPETELLVSWALELLPPPGARSPLVLDVGTGSGCLAAALASERRDLRVVALDVSPAAIAVARDNIAALGVGERVTALVSDLFASLAPTRADLVVSNPPYVPTARLATLAPEITDHEPRVALDGGPDGLAVIARLVRQAPSWLRPGGALLLETFGGDQPDAVLSSMADAGFTDVTTRRDLAGVTRFVGGRRPIERRS
jgi:release factor glutamine methyltransferase